MIPLTVITILYLSMGAILTEAGGPQGRRGRCCGGLWRPHRPDSEFVEVQSPRDTLWASLRSTLGPFLVEKIVAHAAGAGGPSKLAGHEAKGRGTATSSMDHKAIWWTFSKAPSVCTYLYSQ